MNIGDIDGVQVFVTPKGYEELKKQKLIEENEILHDLQERIDKAIEYIQENCIKSDEWYDRGFCDFIPTGKITYTPLSKTKVEKTLQILRGENE